jgi:hypothetical protein
MALGLTFLGMCTEFKIWFLILGHFAMDWYKCHRMVPHLRRFFRDTGGSENDELLNDPLKLPLWIDQVFHFLQMWIVVQ